MFKKTVLFFLIIAVVYACGGSDSEPEMTDNFDRGKMLTHIADNIIIPSYDNFVTKMELLKSVGDTFANNPTQTALEDLRVAWLDAYKNWQHIELFNIGRAEEIQYSFYMNVYPLTVADVEQNITTGNYDLNSSNNHDAQGFPALDYLLYGVANTDADILAKYTTATNNDNYKKYLKDVLNQMSEFTKDVVAGFKADRNSFISITNNTATSSVNKLINDYIFYYEKGLRANKFGIPAGVFSTTALPEKIEGLYRKDVSKTLALEALTAVQNLFSGNNLGSSSANKSTFKDYLLALDREDLVLKIEDQFNSAKSEIDGLNTNFNTQIITDNTKMLRTYDELQKAVVLLKVDMLQAFNINVDYVDADGD